MQPNDQDDLLVRQQLQADHAAPPLTPETFERLAGRIRAEARPVLAAHARRSAWNAQVVYAGRVMAPLALAAGLAALLFVSRTGDATSTTTEETPASTFLAALGGETTTDGVLDATLGSTSGGWMLAAGSK